jgi:molybdate transport system substrate-binding protein
MTLSSIRDHCKAGCLAAALAAVCCGCGARAKPQTLSIAAAADLRFALEEIARDFRAAHPAVDVRVAYGSSGNFYSQIRNNAPFDLFLSADVEYPRRLASEGLAEPDSVFVYAVGRIVVWAPADSPLDVARLRMQALEADSVRHIAIANPQHAPYGRAAEAAMRSAGVYDRAAPKLVLGENIAQTLEFIESGAADVGIVALSLALAPPVRDRGKYWEVPLDTYPKVEQGGAILKSARAPRAAREFRAFLLTGKGARVLRQYGFYLPEK